MMMNGAPPAGQSMRCPKCSLSLETSFFTAGTWVACPACRSELSATFFPALTAPPDAVTTASGERAIEGESVCFFHPEKRAEIACQRCGRFLCALCDVPFGGKHLCPACLDSSKLPELLGRRLVWGQLACLIGCLPLLTVLICPPLGVGAWYFGFVTGPAAMVTAIWGWRKPPSLVHGNRWGLAVLGIIGGLVQLTGSVGFTWLMQWSFSQSFPQ